MRIAVLGAGALGCAIGAALTEGGHETWLLHRSAEKATALQRDGLRIDDATGSRTIPVRATAEPTAVGTVDLVIVTVKSSQTSSAMRGALSLIGDQTLVVSVQNGLGHEDVLAEIVGCHQVLAGKTYVGGVLRGPGHIESGVAGKLTYLGEITGPATPRVRALAEAFTAAGLATVVSDDMVATNWDKLLVNVATGPLAGITGLSYGPLYGEPLLVDVALAAVTEAIAVARTAGVRLTLTDPEQIWRLAAEGLPPSFKTSMLQSLERGTTTEIDVINGAVVRIGRQHGVPTPVNKTLVACIKGIERAINDRQENQR